MHNVSGIMGRTLAPAEWQERVGDLRWVNYAEIGMFCF